MPRLTDLPQASSLTGQELLVFSQAATRIVTAQQMLDLDPPPSALPAAPFAYYGTNVLQARAVALPRSARPRHFVVSTMLRGPDNTDDYTRTDIDPLTLSSGIETCALLGINTLEVLEYGTLQSTVVDLAAQWGITRLMRSRAGTDAFFSWEPFATAPLVDAYAVNQTSFVTDSLKLPLGQVIHWNMTDEPGWYYPGTVTYLTSATAGLPMFHDYLTARGFAPSDFGGTVWGDVLPINQSAAVSAPTRRLYYWTARFIADSFADAMRLYSDALRLHAGSQLVTAVNLSDFLSRWYITAPNQQIFNNTDSGADAAFSAPVWASLGRATSNPAFWTEDWFHNVDAQFWSLQADLLKMMATLSGTSTFGGYVVGRVLINGPAQGGRYKALALLGHGAKILEWYVYGPEERFPDNGWSNNPLAYGQIADANRVIAHAEDVLFPGQPTSAKVALIVPFSAHLWDAHPVIPFTPPETETLFIKELQGIHFALMHMQQPIDFIAEEDLATRLTSAYTVCYVTAPTLEAAAQTALAAWIAAGGVAYFAPGAAARDAFNQSLTTLNAARGITVQPVDAKFANEDIPGTTHDVTMGATTVNGVLPVAAGTDTYTRQIERLTVTTGTVLGTFTDDASAAFVAHASGSGFALSAGVWLGAAYIDSPDRSGAATGHLPVNWSARLRTLLTSPARVAQVVPPVQLSSEVVEAARLDSSAGIAVTLLNWSDVPIGSLTVTVHNCPTITRVVLAAGRQDLPWTQVGATVTVVVALATADVLKLYP